MYQWRVWITVLPNYLGEVNNTRSPQGRVVLNSISRSLCVLLGVVRGFNNTRCLKNRVINNSICAGPSTVHDVWHFNSTQLLYNRVIYNSILQTPITVQQYHTPHPPNFLGPLTRTLFDTVILNSGRGPVWDCNHCVTTSTSFTLN